MKTSSNIFEIPVRSHGVMRLIPGAAPSRHWLSIAILALAAFISYCLFVDASLYADDWYIIWRMGAEPGWVLTGPDIARPLELLAFSIVKNFFGINPLAWRLTLIMLQWLSACLLYMLFVWLMPERRWSALACSLLFLLYPSVLTHTWLAFLNQTVVVCLTLGYALLVVHYIKRGSLVSLAGALFLLLISLLMYEAQLGLAALWGLIVLLIFPQIAWKRRLTALCAILLLCVPYAAWRAYMAGQVANGAVKYSLAEPVSPLRIIGRLLLGARIQL